MPPGPQQRSGGPNPALLVGLLLVVLAALGGGAYLLLSGDDDDSGTTEAHSGSEGGPDEPDFGEVDKLAPPGLDERGVDVDDIDPDDFDMDDYDDPADDDTPLPESDVDAGPADDPPTGAPDQFQDFLAEECYGGDMFACDMLYAESEAGSDQEAYGDTCGGRLEESAIPNCESVLGEAL